jgi:hypothetical protein
MEMRPPQTGWPPHTESSPTSSNQVWELPWEPEKNCPKSRRKFSGVAVRDEPEIDGLCKPICPLSDAGATRQTAMDHFGPLTSPSERIGGEGSPKFLKSPNQDNLPCAFSAQISTSTEMQ